MFYGIDKYFSSFGIPLNFFFLQCGRIELVCCKSSIFLLAKIVKKRNVSISAKFVTVGQGPNRKKEGLFCFVA
jgi:hypothetical protein